MAAKIQKREVQILWLRLACMTSIIYIIWRIVFTLPTESGLLSLVLGVTLVIAEGMEVIEAVGNYRNAVFAEEPELPQIPDDWFPHVDVFIATHNEPAELLFKTVNGCKFMKYPKREKVHIYLCDDGNRTEIKRLAKSMNVGYFGLKDNRHAKAGNLNNALSKTNSPLVVTLDADMIPVSQFLIETVPFFFLPYMEKDENGVWKKREKEYGKIGFIQTPQGFYNPDLFQYNLYAEKKAPNEQDYFFKNVNVRRNRTNTPIYAGSNTVLSREALEKVGGICTKTVTEDFATGIAIQSAGYRCYAISKTLVYGLSPTDMKSLIKQRQRWARGCIHTLFNKKFLFGELSFAGKWSYLQCLLYWWTFLRRLIYLVSPILFTVFGVQLVVCTWWQLALFWAPHYLIGAKAMKIVSGGQRSRSFSNLVDTAIFPFLILPVIAETLGIREKRFLVTDKQKRLGHNSHWKYAVLHLVFIGGSLWGLYRCIIGLILGQPIWHNSILAYWLTLNMYYLIMAVRFMLGRTNEREEERIAANEKVEIITSWGNIEGITADISESGIDRKSVV